MVPDNETGDSATTDEAEAGDAVCSLAHYGLVHGCLKCDDGLRLFVQAVGPVGLSFVDQ